MDGIINDATEFPNPQGAPYNRATMQLQGTVALITGAKRIGAVVAESLAARGVRVGLSYARSEAEARAAAAAVEAAGSRAAIFQADLASPEACAQVVEATVAEFGRLDILINMASVYVNRPLSDLTLADWDAVVNVDLRAAFLCAHAAIPHMRRQGGGRIINFSDWVAASSRPRYLGFLPVPAEGLTREFAEGATPEDVCARTLRALVDAGARHFYISNLPVARAQTVLASILARAGL